MRPPRTPMVMKSGVLSVSGACAPQWGSAAAPTPQAGPPMHYEIRGAVPEDEDQLLEVAAHLNTVNLPADREAIRGILEHAQKSFSGAIKDPRRREYVFVLVDLSSKRLVGTSMIVGQLGRRDGP